MQRRPYGGGSMIGRGRGIVAESAALIVDATGLWQSPSGTVAVLRVAGRCMWPILRSGDQVHVVRCATEDVLPGDIVVVRHESGTFRSHLLTGLSPVRTVTLAGDRDTGTLEVVGRIVQVQRGTKVIPVPRILRFMLLTVAVVTVSAESVGARRVLRRVVRASAFSPLGLRARSWALKTQPARLVHLGDASALAQYVVEEEIGSPEALLRDLRTRLIRSDAALVASFSQRGQMVGLAAMSRSAVQRSFTVECVHVRSRWRKLGIAHGLIEALRIEAARRGAGLDVMKTH